MRGTIISSHGRHYVISCVDQTEILAYPRGKNRNYTVGDHCEVEVINGTGRIIDHEPRSSLLRRSDKNKQKLIAANVSLIIVVIAIDLPINQSLVNRCLVAAEEQNVITHILINKSDLGQTQKSEKFRKTYGNLGYRVTPISAMSGMDEIKALIKNQCSVLVGQSGVGKSTIVNNIVRTANAKTGNISKKLRSGKHTTTNAKLYRIDNETSLIDCPGVQSFGLTHIEQQKLATYFREFRGYLDSCQFSNCTHTVEPNCGVIESVSNGFNDKQRWQEYKRILSELNS